MRGLFVGAVLGSLIVAACGARQNPAVLIDTLGASFGWACPATGCQFESVATTPQLPADCPIGSVWGWVAGRFFDVCYFEPDSSGNGGFVIFNESCRPVVCHVDDDCPFAAFGNDIVYACRNGLCESQEALFSNDAVVMCLSSTSRPATCDIMGTQTTAPVAQVISDANASCPPAGQCNVPADCRQP